MVEGIGPCMDVPCISLHTYKKLMFIWFSRKKYDYEKLFQFSQSSKLCPVSNELRNLSGECGPIYPTTIQQVKLDFDDLILNEYL